MQYTISVANLGELPLTNVIVNDVIPPTVEFVSVQSEGGTCSVSGQTVTCFLGTLEGQQEQTIVITVIPLLEGTVTNSATAQADNTPPVTATVTTLVVRTLECISVSKLFDWVVNRSDFIVEESIPEDCRAFVEQAIAGGRQVLVSCNAVPAAGECSVTVVKRLPLPIIGSQAAIVLTTCSAEVIITLTDSGTGETCTFTLLVKNNEKVSLCLPLPLDESNITSQIFDIHCAARLTDSLTIELQLDWCLELVVKFIIPMMVEATFCQPRALIPIPEVCSISVPKQCPEVFPFV
ncbi:DUF11 domain-containing protein [Paenibacillus melissococcoides]|uniref:DUF11 domain-containing protein n=1 Tax=Paenibacillus melissococcoides TaxID=2912268 RepID=A0ABN8UGJ6_9BACL|nr:MULTISPECIES: DUF11 domain-containing protein [Paenibacillus]MEB9895721.1 DUF11 domain-containing protein [Bacillus cereus]CAH8249483.1 DUF11 domain-containing protein [Paenibacillus melissococcoides]CAH8721221.1 DUF11 domain-containing protein [Paenibacillus melissococcoides]